MQQYCRWLITIQPLPPGYEFPYEILALFQCAPATAEDGQNIAGLGYGYDRGCSGNHATVIRLFAYSLSDTDDLRAELRRLAWELVSIEEA